jgi:hypothetical protein
MIRLDRVSKVFGQTTAVDAVTMEVATGEVCVLLGPSGSTMKAAHPGHPPKPLILRCDPGLDPGEPRRTHPAGAASAMCVLRGSPTARASA